MIIQCSVCGAEAPAEAHKCPECNSVLSAAGTLPGRKVVSSKGGARPSPSASPAPELRERKGGPGGLRGWLIGMLGGQATDEAEVRPGRSTAPRPAPRRTPEPQPRPRIDPLLEPPSSPDEDDEVESGGTLANFGVNLDRLRIPQHNFVLEILDASGQWCHWGPIPAAGLVLGRAKANADDPILGSLAARHLRLGFDAGQLKVEDLGSLNGVCIKIEREQGVELTDGKRFRIGSQVIEFRHTDAVTMDPPAVGDDGEEFCSRELQPLAYLDLIRPNNLPGVRFPITRRDATVIGRDGPTVSLALPNDPLVSGKHAQVRHQDGRFYLEDLGSRNGTYVQISGRHPVKPGDVLLVGRVPFRISPFKAS